ncbi:hypothetical protein D3I60_11140 [Brevibacterium permense]|uniref:hypothetical protein n=1 Tax=Brevibacterium permense TaxID=234834 RepID=UPI0021D3BF43|nr:hypothetical protein [Brevibacterium permense]MCU4297628.1 hypothetical protein [Brevibacterium permense]
MSNSDHEGDHEAPTGQEEREATPGEAFYLRLRSLLATFAHRQTEILRMSEYFAERDAELNDSKLRAKRSIERHLQEEVDEDLLDRYLRVFESYDELAVENDETTRSEREIAFAEGLNAVGSELPKGIESTYVAAITRATRRSVGSRFLHSSLLTILVGEMEMFINQLARACFEVRPGALDQGGRQLTWATIAGCDSIDEVRDMVVDETIDELLRGSLLQWVEFFETRFGLDQIDAARTFEAIEATQRRHCIVHNAGHASQQYLNKLSDFNVETKLNDLLDVDADYVETAADSMFMIAYSLSWALAMKINPEPYWRDHFVTTFTNRTFFLLQEHRFELVQKIGETAPLKSLKGEKGEHCAFIIRVNRWIALKEMGRFKTARKEVEDLPVANRSDDYKLAKHALLDENEKAYEIAQRMIANGELPESHLLTWPLLRGVRDYKRSLESVTSELGAGSIAITD